MLLVSDLDKIICVCVAQFITLYNLNYMSIEKTQGARDKH
jgi:hypothetical protein